MSTHNHRHKDSILYVGGVLAISMVKLAPSYDSSFYDCSTLRLYGQNLNAAGLLAGWTSTKASITSSFSFCSKVASSYTKGDLTAQLSLALSKQSVCFS